MGNIWNTIKSDLKGITGNIAHATITFPPMEEKKQVVTQEGAASAGNLQIGAGRLDRATAAADAARSAVQNAAGAAQSAVQNAAGAAQGVVQNAAGGALPGAAGKVFQVQFNPQSLQINARGGGRVPKTNFASGGATTIEYGELNPYIEISTTLIFDAVNNHDAFFADKFTIGATSVVKGAATAARALAGKTWSVQPQVEGFIGALRKAGRRDITFTWGHMSYTGVLNGVDSKYTMFNSNGSPIRAEVGIRMQCTGDTALSYWVQRYSQISTLTNKGIIKTGGLSDQLGNILNL